jgi:hypothetical protein
VSVHRADQTIATLVWTVPVRLRDVSRGGCCFEVSRHVATGTTGQLHVQMDGLAHLDDIRVARCQLRAGAGRVYQVGVELLRTRRLTRRSLRLAVGRIIGTHAEITPGVDEVAARAVVDERTEQRRDGVSRAPPAAALTET